MRASARKPWQEFYIPIHGLVRLTPAEVTITNHPAVQRLGDIYQLGQVHLVFRGATHRRLEHALGTLHVAKLIIDSLEANAAAQPRIEDGGQWSAAQQLSREEIDFVRLGSLLHDIGHLPTGHTLEDELGLLPPHDADDRLALVLDKEKWRGARVEPTLGQLVNELYAESAERSGLQMSPREILLELVSKDRGGAQVPARSAFRLSVCRDIIGNTICADLLDYLHRDWYHLGKPKHFDTRLIEYMELRQRISGDQTDQTLVIYLRRRDEVRLDAVTAILDLLESRYQLGETALFHHTKLTAAAMLERVLAELGDAVGEPRQEWFRELTEELLEHSDNEMLDVLATRAEQLAKDFPERADQLLGAARLARALRIRHLYRRLLVCFENQLGNDAGFVQDLYSGSEGSLNRLRAARYLEEDFGLPPGSLVLYCPKRGMHTKIAEVRVLVDGSVSTLDEYEQQHRDLGLTGGHLGAQKARFRRLWRIHIAIDRDVFRLMEESGQLSTLYRAVDQLVLGRTVGAVRREENALSIARELSAIEGSALRGREFAPVGAGQRGREVVSYPTGAPTLRSHVVK